MKKQPCGQPGQSLVEAALVLPILLILFLGIAEVGFFLFAQVQVANATREGARYGSLCRLNHTCPDLTNAVKSAVFGEAQLLHMSDAGSGRNTTVEVQPPSLTTAPLVGVPLTVTVVYSYSSPFISNFVPMFPATLPIRHSVVMRFDK
jgi:Flp pilus assembly protein TadG